jgi:two-component system, LuxR family, sensor kinase FixL
MNAVQAIDQSPDQRRRVSVSTSAEDAEVRFSVRDTGPGIPPHDLDRIFMRAFTTKPDGMGLGLAICRSIIESHHGSIRASNGPGGGACFDVVLPAEPC